eukprot:5560873-Amphidinium_carterae.1
MLCNIGNKSQHLGAHDFRLPAGPSLFLSCVGQAFPSYHRLGPSHSPSVSSPLDCLKPQYELDAPSMLSVKEKSIKTSHKRSALEQAMQLHPSMSADAHDRLLPWVL